MKARHARALAVGAGAAFAYLGGARVRDTMPVRSSTLLALATVAVAGMVTARNTVVAQDTRNRLNDFLGNGGHIHGALTVHGDHTVTGDHHVSGAHYVTGNSYLSTADFGGDVNHGGNDVNHMRWLNHTTSNGLDCNDQFGLWYGLWMHGSTIHP